MHGIWLLVFAPIAAVVAWRCSSSSLRKVASYAAFLAGFFLVGWFGYVSFEGAEFTNSLYDRIMHSIGVIVSSINVPILQFMLGAAIVVFWPRRFEFKPKTLEVESDSVVESVADAALDSVVESDAVADVLA